MCSRIALAFINDYSLAEKFTALQHLPNKLYGSQQNAYHSLVFPSPKRSKKEREKILKYAKTPVVFLSNNSYEICLREDLIPLRLFHMKPFENHERSFVHAELYESLLCNFVLPSLTVLFLIMLPLLQNICYHHVSSFLDFEEIYQITVHCSNQFIFGLMIS